MRAIVCEGVRGVSLEHVTDPQIEAPTDVIVRMTSAAICGSDLHMYAGRTVAAPGLVLGHEPLGVVEAVGRSASAVREGDRVLAPFNISCGALLQLQAELHVGVLGGQHGRHGRCCVRLRGDGPLPRRAGGLPARPVRRSELHRDQTPVTRFAPMLRDLVVADKAKPSFVVSHRLPLEDAPAAYAKLEKRVDGYKKVILRPRTGAKKE